MGNNPFNLPEQETRSFSFDDVEVRADEGSDSIGFKGTAIQWDRKADIMGLFREQFHAGAFTKTIVESDIHFFIQHDPQKVLARSRSGSLRLTEAPSGLRVEADMAPTSYAKDLAINMRAQNINEMSIAFTPVREAWDESARPTPIRSVTEAKLFDVSVVVGPSHTGTSASLRSASAMVPTMLEMLGIADLDEEARNRFLMQVHLNEVDAEYAPVLKRAQDQLATYTPCADAQSPGAATGSDAGGDPTSQAGASDVDLRRRRMRLLELNPSRN